jgi:hypothetical protein
MSADKKMHKTFSLNILMWINVHNTRLVRIRPIACDRKKPPDEKFSQSLVARGRVTMPMSRRKKAHQRQGAVSLLLMVKTPSIVAIANGNKNRK